MTKKLARISKFLFIFLLIFAWIFSGFPQIFDFPPEFQKT